MSRKRLHLAVVLAAIVLTTALPARAYDLGPYCDPKNFPYPISGQGTRSQLGIMYNLWIPNYYAKCAQATGSMTFFGTSDSLAARAMLARNGHFFARDIPLTPQERALTENDLDPSRPALLFRASTVQHVPMFLNTLSVVYNLGCGPQTLNLRGEVLGLIYSGLITKWNDRLLVRDNPWLESCSKTIKVAVRSDEAGSSAVLKDYLAKRLPDFKPYTAPQLNTSWPVPTNIVCKGYGDEGVAGCVASRSGSIGYVALKVATDQGLQQAAIDNSAGQFSKGSLAGCTTAANVATTQTSGSDDWGSNTLTNPPSGYALCSYSFMLIWTSYSGAYGRPNTNPQQVRNVRDFFTTILADPVHAKLPQYGMGTLPPRVLNISRAAANSVTYD
jgi:ABC-type phosphate transport system substrate-binding protein